MATVDIIIFELLNIIISTCAPSSAGQQALHKNYVALPGQLPSSVLDIAERSREVFTVLVVVRRMLVLPPMRATQCAQELCVFTRADNHHMINHSLEVESFGSLVAHNPGTQSRLPCTIKIKLEPVTTIDNVSD